MLAAWVGHKRLCEGRGNRFLMRQWELSHGESGIQGPMWMVRVGVEMKSKWDPVNTEKSELAQVKICPGFGQRGHSNHYFAGLYSHVRPFVWKIYWKQHGLG